MISIKKLMLQVIMKRTNNSFFLVSHPIALLLPCPLLFCQPQLASRVFTSGLVQLGLCSQNLIWRSISGPLSPPFEIHRSFGQKTRRVCVGRCHRVAATVIIHTSGAKGGGDGATGDAGRLELRSARLGDQVCARGYWTLNPKNQIFKNSFSDFFMGEIV